MKDTEEYRELRRESHTVYHKLHSAIEYNQRDAALAAHKEFQIFRNKYNNSPYVDKTEIIPDIEVRELSNGGLLFIEDPKKFEDLDSVIADIEETINSKDTTIDMDH